MNNQVFNAAVDGSMARVRETPEYAGWVARYEALEKQLCEAATLAPSENVASEFFRVVWDGINLHADQMFRQGWELRGSPSKLFDLPDGD